MNTHHDFENKEVKMEEILNNKETHEKGEGESEEDSVGMESRIAELEQIVSEKDSEIERLKQTGGELEEKCKALDESLTAAVTGYKTLVIRLNPDLIEDLINGDTIQSIDESLEKAKALVGRIRLGLEAEISKVKVPAGAPERSSPDLTALSPAEKIRYAIGGNE